MTLPFVEDLDVPPDFPVGALNAVHSRALDIFDTKSDGWKHFSGGWRALTYRFLACSEHDQHFTDLVLAHSDSPVQPYRYQQDRELFEFFVSGHSVIECLCFGLHAIGYMTVPDRFPMASMEDRRKVTVPVTSKRFAAVFGESNLSHRLRSLVNDPGYEEWRTVRNTLAHQSLPGRNFYITTAPGRETPTEWFNDVTIDTKTTASRRAWLSQTVTVVATSAAAFLIQNR